MPLTRRDAAQRSTKASTISMKSSARSTATGFSTNLSKMPTTRIVSVNPERYQYGLWFNLEPRASSISPMAGRASGLVTLRPFETLQLALRKSERGSVTRVLDFAASRRLRMMFRSFRRRKRANRPGLMGTASGSLQLRKLSTCWPRTTLNQRLPLKSPAPSPAIWSRFPSISNPMKYSPLPTAAMPPLSPLGCNLCGPSLWPPNRCRRSRILRSRFSCFWTESAKSESTSMFPKRRPTESFCAEHKSQWAMFLTPPDARYVRSI